MRRWLSNTSPTSTTPESPSIAHSRKPTRARIAAFRRRGREAHLRLLHSRFPVVSILATDRHAGRFDEPLHEGLPIYVVDHALIHEIVGFPFHRGVLACGRRVAWPTCKEIVDQAGPRATLVVCPQISNPENLGAIARIGDVFGIDGIVIGPSCPDPLSRRVLRVSMGSVLRLPVIVSDQLEAVLTRLRSESKMESGQPWQTPPQAVLKTLRVPSGWRFFWATRTAGLTPCGLRAAIARSQSPCGRGPARSTSRLRAESCSITSRGRRLGKGAS